MVTEWQFTNDFQSDIQQVFIPPTFWTTGLKKTKPDARVGKLSAVMDDRLDGSWGIIVGLAHRLFSHPLPKLFRFPTLHPLPYQLDLCSELRLRADDSEVQCCLVWDLKYISGLVGQWATLIFLIGF